MLESPQLGGLYQRKIKSSPTSGSLLLGRELKELKMKKGYLNLYKLSNRLLSENPVKTLEHQWGWG